MTKNPVWLPVNDDVIRHIWIDSSGVEHAVPPTFYEEAGTPVDEESDDDMTYVRTERKVLGT